MLGRLGKERNPLSSCFPFSPARYSRYFGPQLATTKERHRTEVTEVIEGDRDWYPGNSIVYTVAYARETGRRFVVGYGLTPVPERNSAHQPHPLFWPLSECFPPFCLSRPEAAAFTRAPPTRAPFHPMRPLCDAFPRLGLFLARKPPRSRRAPPTRPPSPLCDFCDLCAMLSRCACFSPGSRCLHRSISRGSLDKLRHPTFLDAFPSTLTKPADSRALPRT
jgi:hypothetical protein